MTPALLDDRVQQRFWAQVTMAGDACWIWHLAHNKGGYGVFNVSRGHQELAHRAAYLALVGPIPAGMVLDHRCRSRWCVNPFHTDVVTPKENTMRGDSPPAWHVHKRFCPRGHRYDSGNTYVRPGGGRSCRACKRLVEQRRRARRKAARSLPTPPSSTGGDVDGTLA